MMTEQFQRVLSRLAKNTFDRLAALPDRLASKPQFFEPLEARQMMSSVDPGYALALGVQVFTFSPGKNLELTSSTGNKVVFSLTGKGQGEVRVVDGVFDKVSLTGTTTASSMNVAVTGSADGGTVSLNQLTVAEGAINAINAGKVKILDSVDVAASITSVVLGDISSAKIGLNKGNSAAGPSLKLGNVVDSSITITGVLAAVNVTSWKDTDETDDLIKAGVLTRASSQGDFQASISLTGNATATQNTLGSIAIVGNVQGVSWNVVGLVGAISFAGATDLDITAGKIGTINATKSGMTNVNVTADQLSTLVSRGDANNVHLKINSNGTALPVNAKAISGVSVTGNASNLSILSTDGNSNMGSIAVSGNITDLSVQITGDFAGLSAMNVKSATIDALSMSSLSLRGSGDGISITAGRLTNTSVQGDLLNSQLVIDSDATKNFQAVSNFKVVGTTKSLNITSNNQFGNFGTLNLVNSLAGGLWVIAGNMSTLTTMGTLGGLDFHGKSVTNITVGSVNGMDANLLSLGKFSASFVVSDLHLTLNTSRPAQAKGFRALGSFTSTGKADHVVITALGENSNFGAFTFTQGVTDSDIQLNGDGTTFTSPGITGVHFSADKLSTVTLKGAVEDSSFASTTSIQSITVTGNVNGLGVLVNINGSTNKAFSALGSLAVTGNASLVQISGPGANSNAGAITFTGTVSTSKFDINGNVSKLTSKSFAADVSGKIGGNLTTFNTTGLSEFSGNYIIGGGVGKLTAIGSFSAHVTAHGNIGPVAIGTEMFSALIRTTGSIGVFNVGLMKDSMILSGYRADAPLPEGIPMVATDFNNPQATMGNLTIKFIGIGGAASFINSVVAGVRLGTVSLRLINPQAPVTVDGEEEIVGPDFGIAASKYIFKVTGVGLPPLNNLSGSGVKYHDQQFVVKIV
jgi:hypothetical protein